MQDSRQPFSRRLGIHSDPPVGVWNDAPEGFRQAVLSIAESDCEMQPSGLRTLVCRVLRTRPDSDVNWSEYPNIWDEVQRLFFGCPWFRVYDIIEVISSKLAKRAPWPVEWNTTTAYRFETEINGAMREFGIGWQLQDGMVQPRGDEAYEAVILQAKESLLEAGKTTSYQELLEAIKDISRRPIPDVTGAVQHCMAALECVAKDLTGEATLTLGKILPMHPNLVPPPLDQVVHKLWGFASDNARHVREGQQLDRQEAQLVVGLSAALANYLVQKVQRN